MNTVKLYFLKTLWIVLTKNDHSELGVDAKQMTATELEQVFYKLQQLIHISTELGRVYCQVLLDLSMLFSLNMLMFYKIIFVPNILENL